MKAYRLWCARPAQGTPDVSVVIPAYNEADRILPTIAAVSIAMCEHTASWELVVVDDGSSDQTVARVSELHFANLRLLRMPHRGKGAAVRAGVLASRGNTVMFLDADLSTSTDAITPALQMIDDGRADVVIGSRALTASIVAGRESSRKAMTNGLRLFSKMVLGVPVRDSQCGFKVFRGSVARSVFALGTLDRFAFDLEVLYIARALGHTVHEMPVEWTAAPGSTIHASRDVPAFMRDAIKVRVNARQGLYRRELACA